MSLLMTKARTRLKSKKDFQKRTYRANNVQLMLKYLGRGLN
jgi:hypothetical protein